jgi:hypothetical protein
MGYYQSGDYYAAGDPGFFDFLKDVGKGIVGAVGTIAPIAGVIAAPFTGGASLALGAAIGAGARVVGAGLSAMDSTSPEAMGGEPAPGGPAFSFAGMSLGQMIEQAKLQRAGTLGSEWRTVYGLSPSGRTGISSSAEMRTAPPNFGQDATDYTSDDDYNDGEDY